MEHLSRPLLELLIARRTLNRKDSVYIGIGDVATLTTEPVFMNIKISQLAGFKIGAINLIANFTTMQASANSLF